MQNICFIGSFTAGGTERVTYLLINELLLRYADLNIFILNFKNNQPSFPLSNKCHYSTVGTTGRINIINHTRKFLKKNNINTIVNVEALVGLFTIPATIGVKCKHIVWEHANYFQKQNSRWIGLIRKLWMRYANHYIVLTKRDLNNFKRYRNRKSKLSYIYNPISLLSSSPIRYNIHSETIMSAGHLVPIKNFEIIPDIVNKYVDQYPKWKWEIYGGGTTEALQRIRDKIRNYGLEEKIILKGRSEKIDEAYDNAAIFCLTSLQEGLPTVLLEAMLHGIPCVSFDIETGPDEIITDGVDGFVVSAYDIDQYATALMSLMESTEKRARFSKHALENVKKFNMEDSVNKWYKILTGNQYD